MEPVGEAAAEAGAKAAAGTGVAVSGRGSAGGRSLKGSDRESGSGIFRTALVPHCGLRGGRFGPPPRRKGSGKPRAYFVLAVAARGRLPPSAEGAKPALKRSEEVCGGVLALHFSIILAQYFFQSFGNGIKTGMPSLVAEDAEKGLYRVCRVHPRSHGVGDNFGYSVEDGGFCLISINLYWVYHGLADVIHHFRLNLYLSLFPTIMGESQRYLKRCYGEFPVQ